MLGKDVIYRFLNYPKYAWRRFLHGLSLTVVKYFEKLTSSDRVQVFIIDDSVLRRERSKKVELLARVHDHTVGRFIRGYSMLTLGWSDGFSFAPIDFTIHSSAKAENRHCEMQENLDKRTHGYKRCAEALQRKPDTVVQMLQNVLSAGFSANYVLMDSWFTHAPLLRSLSDEGFYTIGMVKELKQKYILNGEHLTLSELYAKIPKQQKAEILGFVKVQTTCGLPLKIVYSCKTVTTTASG
ncbi:MAG: transposase [Clostridiales bacterium]|nr:transposase [Clostridiales bacterium]